MEIVFEGPTLPNLVFVFRARVTCLVEITPAAGRLLTDIFTLHWCVTGHFCVLSGELMLK